MKTVAINKIRRARLALVKQTSLVGVIALLLSGVAHAQMPSPPAANAATTPSNAADAAPAIAVPPAPTPSITPPPPVVDAAPKIAAPAVAPMADNSDAGDDMMAPPVKGHDKAPKEGKGLSGAEDKITDTAKNVAKRMGSTENVTLDDLNSARQAIAKIDALIDIEKRLAELEKIRADRDGGSTKMMAAVMPAAALNPMPMATLPPPNYTPPPPMPIATPVVMPMPTVNLEVSRIIGGAGRYSAMVKTPDGESKTVQVGDHLPGGDGKVTAITADGVEYEQNGKTHTVPVKNVSMVFSNSP